MASAGGTRHPVRAVDNVRDRWSGLPRSARNGWSGSADGHTLTNSPRTDSPLTTAARLTPRKAGAPGAPVTVRWCAIPAGTPLLAGATSAPDVTKTRLSTIHIIVAHTPVSRADQS